ncbi:MAG: 5-(carboxyamino)imidazole ribonucleotide mutase [Betaproteobacteria bacterium]|nr:5-(carboxyamino)imidazole ribonucleotide mutase [Betaproteobacteria bacterium]
MVSQSNHSTSVGTPHSAAVVGVVMGSASDYETMSATLAVLNDCGVPYECTVVSAHRTPERLFQYARTAAARGLKVIVAGAGGAAHLPGMIASLTALPVLGVPVQSKSLQGLDSLLSIVQMPGGVPTATFAIGTAGARNAGLFALQILALQSEPIARWIEQHKQAIESEALEQATQVEAQSGHPLRWEK